ncbi:MAG: PTS glucitol/sorbitol transporter subunit IIC [Candidatus Dormibacteraeota bacterium]|nr:PTS glucitol/sorbitol transporter subunit IIC [Candidatus Dormibacteraeota bacterium]
MDIFGGLVWLATHFIGIFQQGAAVFSGLVLGIVPLLIVLMTAVYALTRLIGPERIDRVVQVAARPGLQYYPLRYLVAPVLSVFFLTNPMAYTQGRWFPEKYKPAFYDAAVSYVHPPLGLFPHINPGEIFVWAGIAAGITKLKLSLPELAVRYALVGLVVIFIRGIVTERITAFLMGRARKSQALEAEAEATALSQAGTPELETQPSRG